MKELLEATIEYMAQLMIWLNVGELFFKLTWYFDLKIELIVRHLNATWIKKVN